MDAASTNVVLTHMLQNQHIRRAWRFLRPGTGVQQRIDADKADRDANSVPTTTSNIILHDDRSPVEATGHAETERRIHAIDSRTADNLAEGSFADDDVADSGQQVAKAVAGDEGAENVFDSCEFAGEAEEDYTNGPCRLMAVSDAGKTSVALMLTFDLSGRIQDVIGAQRLHQKERTHTELQLAEIERLEESLREVVRDKEYRLDVEQEEDQEEDQEENDTVAPLRRELEVLQTLVHNTAMKKRALNAHFQWCTDDLLDKQALVTEYLSAAFTRALLVGPEDDETQPVESFDLEKEYQGLHKALYDDDEFSSDTFIAEPLSTENVNVHTQDNASQDPERLARLERINAIREARFARNNAERHFDSRGDRRDQEWQDHRVAEFNGLPTRDASKEDFDLRWVVEDRLTTRALIEAEETLADAKTAAANAGVEVLDPEDDIPEYAYEFPGHPLSEEKEVGVIIPNDRVESWRNEVADVADSGELSEDDVQSAVCRVRLDYWDFREVQIGDSSSCVDWDCYTEDIVKWRDICSAAAAERSNSV